jgi:hypothetical protein
MTTGNRTGMTLDLPDAMLPRRREQPSVFTAMASGESNSRVGF